MMAGMVVRIEVKKKPSTKLPTTSNWLTCAISGGSALLLISQTLSAMLANSIHASNVSESGILLRGKCR